LAECGLGRIWPMFNSQCSILIRKGKRPHVCGGTFGNPTSTSD